MRISLYLLASLLLAAANLGCSAAGSENIDNAFATTAGKTKLLKERVDKFHQALYWGSVENAIGYVSEELRRDMVRSLANEKQKQKIVDLTIDYIDYQPDGVTAIVDVRVRYYPIPSYTIETRIDQETWQFDRFGGGWFLTSRSVSEELGRDSFQFN